ncbi:ATP-binding protein [Ketogulonicigenium robustum]|uniref:tRNA threonylcarbamoyladenosine biosynthesis protein TsaE n=1 Tax=Ketogulonicigenium robustum TaxID=92947 RepID=A0A1W6P2P6_9RHOB|nr:tRNA (adenosine(37)-N6)-threonylcarbamoyltransferase complex ATPase subunit type 1 TsaE [Ketogulonicigenium robustum]ARO15714.1 ATP-binding protein [Ketogulonicigenium robustum]
MEQNIALRTETDTAALAAHFAALLHAGDVLLLEGQIGAGKSFFARALIRARLQNPHEDVPSPTFTLVQTYDADVQIWHSDLYRLTHPDEVIELGLTDAFADAICLIEWPDRLGSLTPAHALTLSFAALPDGTHRVAISGDATWEARLAV